MLHIHVLFVAPLGASHMAQPCTDQHQSGVAIREDPHHTGPAADLPVQPLNFYAPFNLRNLLDLLTKAKKLLKPTVVPAEQSIWR